MPSLWTACGANPRATATINLNAMTCPGVVYSSLAECPTNLSPSSSIFRTPGFIIAAVAFVFAIVVIGSLILVPSWRKRKRAKRNACPSSCSSPVSAPPPPNQNHLRNERWEGCSVSAPTTADTVSFPKLAPPPPPRFPPDIHRQDSKSDR
eukprot:Gregarina_sp_Poly_1__3405@NODE_1989_length_2932_cov_153_970681_g1283_i0_p3_GENE_NODE_1989_length_2932_cov_153_970681_g1283_i0NODE_1989_length_2932_cov_153_970681_g1283_i0_p3_ORF_typecomplete_len151_score11_48HisKA_7TM/PF16927_5/0_038ATP1G1_PLM_MAT8/PF02038_16/0_077LapA_dom/PF06305_11/0_18Adeno_E3_CR2/PF02439_15/0_24NDUF_B12/PF08122_12/0_18NDUF_B12/PF08122_12/7_2e03DUF2207/PF09972_9/0_28CcmD/PF04995_14/8_4FeoB_associated/PF12669_7/8_5FeoB_associated/PF12669_7/1_8e04_NODE_1989_length_2932_cov_153_